VDEVDAGEGAMLIILALEHDDPTSLNADHRSVVEHESAVDTRVQLREGASHTHHVVRRASTDHPLGGMDLRIFITELHKNFLPHEMSGISR
jgi:hypothetical protein